jgi:hypothetical protein
MTLPPVKRQHNQERDCVRAEKLLYLQALEIVAGDAPVGDMLAVAAEQCVFPAEADLGQSLRLGHDLVRWKWIG